MKAKLLQNAKQDSLKTCLEIDLFNNIKTIYRDIQLKENNFTILHERIIELEELIFLSEQRKFPFFIKYIGRNYVKRI